MKKSSSNSKQEHQPKVAEVVTSKNLELVHSSKPAVFLPLREVQHSSSAPEVRIPLKNYETDKSNKETSKNLAAFQRSKSPKSFRQRLYKGSLRKHSLSRITSHESDSTIRISQVIATQPKEEKEWQEPQKKPMTGTTFREMNDYRRNLKEWLHVPTQRELKRSHVAYYVSLCSEMEEDGFPDAANFISYLIDFDKQRRESAEGDSLIQYEPKLMDNKSHLTRLGIGLREAAKARISEDVTKESNCILQLAVFFTKEAKEWWWLAQQLFEKCIDLLKDVSIDGGENYANARYCYGHFLLKQVHDPDKAKENLQIAYSLSSGKQWPVSEGPTYSSKLIYMNACNLLYEALVETAIQTREKDPKAAVHLCNLALRRANEGEFLEGQARVMLELGICMMAGEDIPSALEVFYKLLEMKLGANNLTYICNAHLQVALCYKHVGDFEKALQHLEEFKNIAEKNELTEQLAAINRYLGEFYLNMDAGSLAKSYLETSFKLYLELEMAEEIEKSRILAAIGAGHEVLADYIHLIRLCGDPRNIDAFTKLLSWKISNVPFWKTSELPVNKGDSINEDSETASNEQLIETEESVQS